MLINPQKHGAVPFWFWNGNQDESELTRQMEMAAEAGFKGLAIHARRGNQTEYMSTRWLALTRHCCEEAIRLGLDIWLYDEEGFPSGTVGGRLQQDQPFYQQKQLRFAYMRKSRLAVLEELVSAYDARTYKRVTPETVPPDQDILAFFVDYFPRYVDTLKRETAEKFMDMTHRPYFRELRAYFGTPITHIYTDDLNSNLDRGPSLPYTEKLFTLFHDRFGYDLLDHLPDLVENLPGCEKIRLDFRTLILTLFLEEFVAPMHHWCEEHGVRFTGHLSGDEGEMNKSAHAFGAAMPFYEHEHMPGIDDFLCSVPSGCYLDQLRNPRNHCPVILFKQASSVANQLKKGHCGCECLTFLGWGASVQGQSALLNYELALGINLFTHHDFSYATGGVAKRDCPPSYFFQQPYWFQYKHFHAAISRSAQLLKRGRYAADCLVIHPMSSCWIAMDGGNISIDEPFEPRIPAKHQSPMELEDGLAAVSHELLKLRVGFEYGDEWLMAKHACVKNGALQLGDMTYTTVIIPPVSHLLGATIDILRDFAASGGKIIAMSPVKDCLVDGRQPGKPVFGATLKPTIISAPDQLRSIGLLPTLKLEVAEENANIICHSRDVDGCREHFVLNMSNQTKHIAWTGDLHAYDPVDNCGVKTDTPHLALPPFHSIHLLPDFPEKCHRKNLDKTVFFTPGKLTKERPAADRDPRSKPGREKSPWIPQSPRPEERQRTAGSNPGTPLASGEELSQAQRSWSEKQGNRTSNIQPPTSNAELEELPDSAFSISLDQPNLLLVDTCIGLDGTSIPHTDSQALPGATRLQTVINIPDPEAISGVLGEAVTLSSLSINGRPLPPATKQHPASQDLLIAEPADLFIRGRNVIECDRQNGNVLFEPFYLMGDFGVRLVETERGMRPDLGPLDVGFGDLVETGAPFYWGGVNYETTLDRDEAVAWLDCGLVDGVVTLTINGIPVGRRYVTPYRFYIAGHLRPGTNRLSLTLFNTAQNLFGPHRHPQQIVLNPLHPRGEKCPSPYYLAAYGIHGPVVIE
ncbi:MAG: hypothetical protein RRC34_07140 [Lentisphaeria bacterium]|nr:hypothetical protein [Lentisphaeria bacterium]